MVRAWKAKTAATLVATLLLAGAAEARSITWARTGDALTLDPHAQNEGPTHNLLQQIYEPLDPARAHRQAAAGARRRRGRSRPTRWSGSSSCARASKFHNGSPFNADDVVFSIERALQPTSDMKGIISSIEKVTKVDDHTVHLKTKGPNPILPDQLTNIYMMDKEWAEANSTVTVQDYKAQKDNFAVRNANGTGPYSVVSREQDVRTVLKLFDGYWGKGQVPLGIEAINYVTIKKDETRVAALLVGRGRPRAGHAGAGHRPRAEDAGSARSTSARRTAPSSSAWTWALADLKSDDVQGKNPFADKRVRQAINMAIDREGIRRAVMRAQSKPSGMIIGPFVNGYNEELRQGAGRQRRQGQGAADGGGLRQRLLDRLPLPQRPLCLRRGHLPGDRADAGRASASRPT